MQAIRLRTNATIENPAEVADALSDANIMAQQYMVARLAEVAECGNEEADTEDAGGLENNGENLPSYSQDGDIAYTTVMGIGS
nr:hypothetical protein Iba_chr05dCG9770 [Ipomoea batatas]